MLRVTNLNTTSIVIEHNPTSDLTVASFEWPIANPERTYTIDVGEHVSIELDRAFGVRPAGVTLAGPENQTSLSVISRLFGENFARAMVSARVAGMCVLKLTLDDNKRLAIAETQLASPSTPATIRAVCEAVAKGISARQVQQKIETIATGGGGGV